MKHHYLFAILAPVFWSLAGVVVKSLSVATEWQINFYRCGALTLFVGLVILLRYRRSGLSVIRKSGKKGFFAGCLLSGAMLCNVVALKYTPVAVAVCVMAAAPVFAALLANIILQERTHKRGWISIGLAFVGIAIMVGGRLQVGDIFGVSVAILGIMFFGAYAVSLRIGKNLDMTPAVLCGGFVGTLISCGMSFATGVGLLIPLAEALWCSALGVVQLGLGSVLFALAAQTVPAVQLTLFSLGEPVLAPIWVLIAFNEVPTGATLVGGGILLIALVLQLFDRSS